MPNFSRWRTGIVAGLLLTMVTASGLAAEGAKGDRPLRARVVWQLPEGGSRTLSFKGTTDGSKLAGTLRDGKHAMQVVGTVAADGAVRGDVVKPDGTLLGTFSGHLDDKAKGGQGATFTGNYKFDGKSSGGGLQAVELSPGQAP